MTISGNLRKHHLWILVIGIAISIIASALYWRTLQQDSAANIERMRTIYAVRTENVLNSIFHKTDVLAAVVKIENGNITEQIFQDTAKLVYQENSGIRGIQYMPGAVVTYSYPVKGNEAVMGKNFLTIPERRKDVLLAIDTQSIALSGPYHLIQGGLGVVARNPIFLTDASGNEYFWGFSAIILDLPEAISSVGLEELHDAGYDYQLFCVNENNERLIIDGNPDLDVGQAICGNIQVPHHEWNLAVKELNPWMNIFKAGIMLLVGLLLSRLLWLQYRLMLEKEATIREKDRFFSDISHDMRTPLNAILGFSVLAQQPKVTEETKDMYLKKIESSGKLLLDLVNDTLTISKVSSGKMTMTLVPMTIDIEIFFKPVFDAIRELADAKKIEFTVDSEDAFNRTVMVDELNLQKVLLNLLTNAVKYTPIGGHVHVRFWNEVAADGCIDSLLSVQDDGIGMSQEFQMKVFEPFSQENREGYEGLGTGLGLAIVKQLVVLMGGTISLHSVMDQGSTFIVRLHLPETISDISQPVAVAADTDTIDFDKLSGRQILLCEDNQLNTEIACALLEEKGMIVTTAKNGKIGLELFVNHEPGTFAAILMDLRMPIMDGYESTRSIRSLNRPDARQIPIFAMTADAFSEDIQKCMDVGMDGHIAKPIDPAALYATLASCIK